MNLWEHLKSQVYLSARSGTAVLLATQEAELGCGHGASRMRTRLYPRMSQGAPALAQFPFFFLKSTAL